VKLLQKQDLFEEEFKELKEKTLPREAAIMWCINNHPNCIWFNGVYQSGSDIGLVFEYCDGGSLEKEIKTDLSIERRCQYIDDLLNAVRFLHSKGVVHRDIKPSNILFTTNTIAVPNEEHKFAKTLKVADFGSA